jgi:hypothetical protein
MCDGFELYYMEHMAAEAAREQAAAKKARAAKLDAPRQAEPVKEEQPAPVPV